MNVFHSRHLFIFGGMYVSTWMSVAGHCGVNVSYSESGYII
jgi:hypothetical protein